MYAAAPMPNTPAVPPLFIPGGVDPYGFYVLSASSAVAADPLETAHPTCASPSAPHGHSHVPTLAEEVRYWENSFGTYLGLCTIADRLATEEAAVDEASRGDELSTVAGGGRRAVGHFDTTRPSLAEAEPRASHSSAPSTTAGLDDAPPTPSPQQLLYVRTSRLRVPVTSVVQAAVDATAQGQQSAQETSPVSPSGSTSSTGTLPLPPSGSNNNNNNSTGSSNSRTVPTAVSLPACLETTTVEADHHQYTGHVSAVTVEAVLDEIERDWENHLWTHGGAAHSELRRLLWSFWSGAAHRTAEEQAAADAEYAALVARDVEADAVDSAGSGKAALAPLRHEEVETIHRDLSRTFPTHCLFTASAESPPPPHLCEQPAFLFSPSAKAALASRSSVVSSDALPSMPAPIAPARPGLTLAVGQTELNRLLRAYSHLDSEIGYCQGMSFVAAVLLLHAPEPEAFQMFFCLLQNPVHSLRDLYAPHFGFLHTLIEALDQQVRQLLPVLHRHLQAEGVAMEYFAASWFLTLFATQLPMAVVVPLWDWFMLKGWSVMFQAAIAVLQWRQEELLTMDMEAILLTLKGLKTAAYQGAAVSRNQQTSLLATSPTTHMASEHGDDLSSTGGGAASPTKQVPLPRGASRTTLSPPFGAAASPTTSAASPTSAGTASSGVSAAAANAHAHTTGARDTEGPNGSGAASNRDKGATRTNADAEDGDEAEDAWLSYLNEPAVPAQAAAPHEHVVTPEDTAEMMRRILQVPIDMDDIPALW